MKPDQNPKYPTENKTEHEKPHNRKKKIQPSTWFYRNSFVLLFSFLAAFAVWVSVSMNNDTETEQRITNVPIQVKLSQEAMNDNIHVFGQSQLTADVVVTGNSLITKKLNRDSFEVVADYAPSIAKFSGTALKKEAVSLKVSKKAGDFANYDIVSVEPEEVALEVDRLKEITMPIVNEVDVTGAVGFYVSEPNFSDTTVAISGPESAVNLISRISAKYEISNPIQSEEKFSCDLTLYGQDDKPIEKYADLFIRLSQENIDVVVPVLRKKTYNLIPNVINIPEGFSSTRISVSPEKIEVAGPVDEMDSSTDFSPETAIDFSEVNFSQKSFSFDIQLPKGVRNISNTETAKVDFNLNGYVEQRFTTSNIQLINKPSGKNVELFTKNLEIDVIGSDAQVSKLTGESISVKVDLSSWGAGTGSKAVPATVSFSGANTCWASKKYTVDVNVLEDSALQAVPAP